MTRIQCPLAAAAATYGSEPAILDRDVCLDYMQLDRIAQSVGDRFAAEIGQRVGIQAETSWRYVAFLWSLFRVQATVCLFSPSWPDTAVEAGRHDLSTSRFVDSNDLEEIIREPTKMSDGADCYVDDRSIATILFTSGSTSKPKALAHDLHAHLASASGSNINLPLGVGDRWLLALPLHHVSGLSVLFRCCSAGAQIVVPDARESLSQAIDRLRPSHISLVPTQLKQLRQESQTPPASLRAVLLGGSSWPVALVKDAVRDGWPILTTYGLSEMASQVTTTHATTKEEHLGTAGRTLSGRELMVSDSGEILVRGETLFRGYVSGNQLRLPLDDRGWFHTGDLGQMDQAGYLTVDGRRDNMFISGGENIYPEEIESRLLEIDSVRHAIVVAVPDSRFGQRPVAFVDAEPFIPDAWCERLEEHLPPYKLPDRFLPWPQNISPGMKANRRQFAELAAERSP